MTSIDIFSMALGLSSPWQIREVRFSEVADNARELHIYLDFPRGYKFLSRTGEPTTAYDSEAKRWLHLNFFQHKCYLHARVPRLQDSQGQVYQIDVPLARSGSGFTLLFDAYSMLLIEYEMPVCKVADTLDVTQHRIWRIFNYWIKRAFAKDDLSRVTRIGGATDKLPDSQLVFDKFHLIKLLNEALDNVAYFNKKATDGILEGINSKIQLAKRRARGYRNIENFINMTYLISAKLNLNIYPYETL